MDTVLQDASLLQVSMDVKPGVDRVAAGAALDQAVADFLRDGPGRDEVERAVTGIVTERIGALEVVGGFGGKGATLAEGQLYAGDPAHERQMLQEMVALTPEAVRDAMRRWLSRPVYALDVVPGERTLVGAKMGRSGPSRCRASAGANATGAGSGPACHSACRAGGRGAVPGG
jgi:hypothetical protein